MALGNPFSNLALSETLSTLLPDFVLAVTFFTALLYAVLGRRFGPQRPAAAMSVALGLALATGLVWWEKDHGWSIRSLGPIAVIIVLVLLAAVLFSAARKQGGFWVGVGIALGICIPMAWLLGVQSPIDTDLVWLLAVVGGVLGALGIVVHLHRYGPESPRVVSRVEVADARRDRRRIDRSYDTSNWIRQNLKRARLRVRSLTDHPGERADLVLQIRRILPAEGQLTRRMAALREKAHRIRNGHVSRLEETKLAYSRLPTSAKKKAAEQLIARYRALAGINDRLERLDREVAETERHVRLLTLEAQEIVARYDFPKVEGTLKRAERLQARNSQLLKVIDRTERKLAEIAGSVAEQAQGTF